MKCFLFCNYFSNPLQYREGEIFMKKLIILFVALVVTLHFSSKAYSGPIRNFIGKKATERSKVDDPEKLLPKGGKLMQDVSYGDDPEQMIDVYLPPGKPKPQIIFMVHGGGWVFGDRKAKKFIENKVKRWVPKGFIVISVGYRLLPKANPLEQADDVAKALAFSQKKAQLWGGEPKQFVLLGHSAGAHLVTLISSSSRWKESLPLEPILGTISLDSAVMNTPELMNQKHPKLYDDAMGSDPKFWELVSPFHQLKAKASPFYIVCSSERKDSCDQGKAFGEKLKSFGGQAELLRVDMSHAELNEKLGEPGMYTHKIEGFLKGLGLDI